LGLNNRWRRNPFNANVVNSVAIVEEEHTIEFHEEPSAYGFYANEGILLDTNDPVVLVQDNTAQTAFTEIPRTIAPSSGQFRVDYDADGYYNTGFVQCNAADTGKAVLFTYRGTGTLVHPTFRLQTDFNYAGNINVEGELSVQGNVSLAEDTGATLTVEGDATFSGNAAMNGVVTHNGQVNFENDTTGENAFVVNGQAQFNVFPNLPDGTNDEPEDYQAARYIDVKNNHGIFFTTSASDSFTVPHGVSQLYVELAGGGGGGGGGSIGVNVYTRGGGGGGSSLKKGILSVTPGQVLSISLGTGGAGGAAGGDGVAGGDGGNGGNSTITINGAPVFTALGGNGGKGARATAFFPGDGGSRTTDNASCGGGGGGYTPAASGVQGVAYGGVGGGVGGGGSPINAAGSAGQLGAGGGGGSASAGPVNAARAGGAGGNGYCLIQW
jgi:hypothetical protein